LQEQGNQKNKVTQEVIRGYGQSLVKIILCCSPELPFQFGKNKLIRVLTGSKSSFVIDHEIYGILPNFRHAYLETVINKMQEADLLEIEMVSQYQNRPTLKITQKGRDCLDGQYNADIRFAQGLSDKEVILLDDEEQELFEEPRAKRNVLATEKSIPAYAVCSNIRLREMDKYKPMNESELLSIKGIGGKFTQNYGDDNLGSIESFSKELGVIHKPET